MPLDSTQFVEERTNAMRTSLSLMLAGALMLTSGVASAAADRNPEAQIARATAGRISGKPVDCILLRDIRSSRIIPGTAIIYETNNGTIYVNRPPAGAFGLRSGDVLVTDTHSSQLCSVDIVRLYDTSSRMQTGSVGLGPFIPYTKPAKTAAN